LGIWIQGTFNSCFSDIFGTLSTYSVLLADISHLCPMSPQFNIPCTAPELGLLMKEALADSG
jgi:hypothetical protein